MHRSADRFVGWSNLGLPVDDEVDVEQESPQFELDAWGPAPEVSDRAGTDGVGCEALVPVDVIEDVAVVVAAGVGVHGDE